MEKDLIALAKKIKNSQGTNDDKVRFLAMLTGEINAIKKIAQSAQGRKNKK